MTNCGISTFKSQASVLRFKKIYIVLTIQQAEGMDSWAPERTFRLKQLNPWTLERALRLGLGLCRNQERWNSEFTGPGTAVRCVPPHFNPCNFRTISLFSICLHRLLIMLFNNLVVYTRKRLRPIACLSYTFGSLNLLPSMTLICDRYAVRFVCFYVYVRRTLILTFYL